LGFQEEIYAKLFFATNEGDFRITGMATYPLDEILLAMPVGGVCGA
jgi:hypothetical protein